MYKLLFSVVEPLFSADKLSIVEALQERIKLLEAQLEQSAG